MTDPQHWSNKHWSNHLIRSFPPEGTSTVEIALDASTTRIPVVVVASRITGLIDALGPVREDGTDPLAEEDPGDLLWLLDHLNRTVGALRSQEDRLIGLLREKGVSYARIATVMEMTAPGIRRRHHRAVGLPSEDNED